MTQAISLLILIELKIKPSIALCAVIKLREILESGASRHFQEFLFTRYSALRCSKTQRNF
jgi:hypothetical protein